MIRAAVLKDSMEMARLSAELGYPASESQISERLRRLLEDRENAIYVFQPAMTDHLAAGFMYMAVFCWKALLLPK